MKAWSLADFREVDRYPGCIYFLKKEDAEKMRTSFGSDSKHWDLHEIEIIE